MAHGVAATHKQSAAAHSASHSVAASCSTMSATPLCRLRCCCLRDRLGGCSTATASAASSNAAGATASCAVSGSAAASCAAGGRAAESCGLPLLQLSELLGSRLEGSWLLRGVGGGLRLPADRGGDALSLPLAAKPLHPPTRHL